MENNNKRYFVIAIVIVLLASLVFLNSFNILGPTLVYFLLSWKTLLIVIGLALILLPKHTSGGIILSCLGIIFWLPELFNNQFQLGEIFLPSVLIVIGVIILLRARGNKKYKKHPDKIAR